MTDFEFTAFEVPSSKAGITQLLTAARIASRTSLRAPARTRLEDLINGMVESRPLWSTNKELRRQAVPDETGIWQEAMSASRRLNATLRRATDLGRRAATY